MRTILHILTRPEEELARQLIARQSAAPDFQIDVIDLSDRAANYDEALDKIFAADSISVW
jgi:hypothetical protein